MHRICAYSQRPLCEGCCGPVYDCDPTKNTKCSKSGCGECAHTFNPDFAKEPQIPYCTKIKMAEDPRAMNRNNSAKRFPEAEARVLVDWMREQMYGSTPTEWTYGDEHDAMEEAEGFLNMLLRELCDENVTTRGGLDDGEGHSE